MIIGYLDPWGSGKDAWSIQGLGVCRAELGRRLSVLEAVKVYLMYKD